MNNFREVSGFSGIWENSIEHFDDNRGSFFETFRENDMPPGTPKMIQDNISESKLDVLRGIHVQAGQWQLITVIKGEIIDISIDLRIKSSNYLQTHKVKLSQGGTNQILLAPGIGHGFIVVSKQATLHYKSTKYYGETEQFTINMLLPPFVNLIPPFSYEMSKRDLEAPSLESMLANPTFLSLMNQNQNG